MSFEGEEITCGLVEIITWQRTKDINDSNFFSNVDAVEGSL